MVLDASAAVELLLQTPGGARLAERLEAGGSIHVPHLLDIEVANALRRLVRIGLLRNRDAAQALQDLADLEMHRHSHTHLLDAIWKRRHNLTAYDATYVVLATALGQTLVTGDARLAAAPGLGIEIERV